MSPKFSIVVPTRERKATLGPCLQTCLAQHDVDYEIVVQDNASEDDTGDVVRAFDSPRIRYFRQPERVSMRANFESGLQNARGDYVIMIGDDDGLVPGGLQRLDRLTNSGSYEFITWPPLDYIWPGVVADEPGHFLVKRRYSFRTKRSIDLNDIVECLTQSRVVFDRRIPKIYHGCVSRTLIDRMRTKAGEFFLYDIPDVYVQIAMSLEAQNGIALGHWITINGRSLRSNGGSAFTNRTGSQEVYRGSEYGAFIDETAIDKGASIPFNSAILDLDYYRYVSLLIATKSLRHNLNVNHDAWIERIVSQIFNSPHLARIALDSPRLSDVDERIFSKLSRMNVPKVEELSRNFSGPSPKSTRSQLILTTQTLQGDDVYSASTLLVGAPCENFSDNVPYSIMPLQQLLRWGQFVFNNRSRLRR
jgi:glycosyltransferase involved in cell wall biosynthesis